MRSAKPPVKRWKVVLKRIALTVAALFTFLVVLVVVLIVLTQVSIYHPKSFDQKRFDQIASDIQTGKLKTSGAIVVLPPALAEASATGRAYVTKGFLFIPSWMGRHQLVCTDFCDYCDQQVDGFLYSPKPLKKINLGDPLYPFNLPHFCKPWESSGDSSSQIADIYIDGEISGHWYKTYSFASTENCL